MKYVISSWKGFEIDSSEYPVQFQTSNPHKLVRAFLESTKYRFDVEFDGKRNMSILQEAINLGCRENKERLESIDINGIPILKFVDKYLLNSGEMKILDYSTAVHELLKKFSHLSFVFDRCLVSFFTEFGNGIYEQCTFSFSGAPTEFSTDIHNPDGWGYTVPVSRFEPIDLNFQNRFEASEVIERPILKLCESLSKIDFGSFDDIRDEVNQLLTLHSDYFSSNESITIEHFLDLPVFGYRREGSQQFIESTLRKLNLNTSFSDFARFVLYILGYLVMIAEINDDIQESLNMYHHPELLLSHSFEKMKESEYIKYDPKNVEYDNPEYFRFIKQLYEKCYDATIQAITPTIDFRVNEVEVNLYDSLDLFVALNLTLWLIVYDESNTEEYLDSLKEFLSSFLNDFRISNNINPYLKAKFREILENYMTYKIK